MHISKSYDFFPLNVPTWVPTVVRVIDLNEKNTRENNITNERVFYVELHRHISTCPSTESVNFLSKIR